MPLLISVPHAGLVIPDEVKDRYLPDEAQTIDDGDGFYPGFDSYLETSGYVKRNGGPCTCSDGGSHGHMPECRWVKA